MKFDITIESKRLKEIVSQYNSESFIGDIAELLTLIEPPRIPFYPFQGLDSPFRQLTYLASLNISSGTNLISKKEVETDEAWKEIVVQSIKARAGYYDELLPKEEDDAESFYSCYQTSMPVFNNYFDTGNLNYEEQEIERIENIFSPFNDTILNLTGLEVNEFIEIYNLIDKQYEERLNTPTRILRESVKARHLWDEYKRTEKHPREWNYQGTDKDFLEIIKYFTERGAKFKISKTDLCKEYDKTKISLFLSLFEIEREDDKNYLYYTQPNKVLLRPLFKISRDKYIIIDIKQIIHAVYRKLHSLMDSSKKREAYFKYRGNWLQNKTEDVLRNYFGKSAHIYNEYKVENNAQDILLLFKNLALIIENKAHREVQLSGIPDTINIYKQIFSRFKKSIIEGYEQCWRIKDKFYFEDSLTITDLKNKPIYCVNTSKYPNVFSIIITLDKFREPQINTPELVELNEDDDFYPLSMSINDFEVLMLTLKKKKISLSRLIQFFRLREKLQGRLDSNDELEIWGAFLNSKNFEIPSDERFHFKTHPFMTDIYDLLYERGLGFKNEKNIDKKRDGRYIAMNSVKNRITTRNTQ